METILDVVFYVIPVLLGFFGAKWGVEKWAKLIAKKAVEGKKYLKEVDDVLTEAGNRLSDGELSSEDLRALFKESKDIWQLINGANVKMMQKKK